MTGLRLTVAQACRLWQIDREACERLLAQLVRDDFLRPMPNGTYIALPGARRALKAAPRLPAPAVRTA